MSRLINLIKPERRESLESYLLRLGEANYYEESNWYYKLAHLPRETHVNYVSEELYLRHIADVVSLSKDEIRGLTIHNFASKFYIDGSTLWEEGGRAKYLQASVPSKVCSRCLLENGAYQLQWLLRPVTTCYEHKVKLIDECPSCKKPLVLSGLSCT